MPRMDEIEVVTRMQPRTFYVIDGEFNVWGNPCWLDGRQINPEHGRALVLFSHCSCQLSVEPSCTTLTLDRPDTSTGAHIQDSLRIVTDRCKV